MRVEIIDKDNIFIFLNKEYLVEINFKSKTDMVVFIKDFISKYKKKFKLSGFYKILVYGNEKVGLFLDIIRLDDILYNDSVDIRVILNTNGSIYFVTKDYYVLPSDIKIYYCDGYFYCNVDDIPNILDMVEFGSFIYGKRVNEILSSSRLI